MKEKKKKKDVSSGFPGWRESLCGVYACLCVCSRSCSHTPGSFTLTATGNLTEGGRCLNIHQPSSKCSVWARCDGPGAGTELPKQLFIFPNVFIFSSSTPSPLVSTYNRGLAVPASPPLFFPLLTGVRIEMANRGERSGFWGSLKVSSLVWKWGRKWEQKMLEGADVKYSIDLLLSYFPHDIGSSTVSKGWVTVSESLFFFLKFFQWCVSSFQEPKLPSSYTENKFHCSLVSCANEASLALSRQRGKGAFHVSLQAGVVPPPLLYRGAIWWARMKRKDGEDQLKRMESGSLLAICAMCLRMSFLVMIPSSLLKTETEKQNKSGWFKVILWSPRHGKPARVTESRNLRLRPGPLSRHSWFSFIKRSQGNWQITATWKHRANKWLINNTTLLSQIKSTSSGAGGGLGGGQRNGSRPRHPAINCATLRGHLICCILATDDFQQIT